MIVTNFYKITNILFQNTKVSFNNTKIKKHHNKSAKLIKEILENKDIGLAHKLDSLVDEDLDYCNYTNTKYYRAGFIDCLNLILPTLNI